MWSALFLWIALAPSADRAADEVDENLAALRATSSIERAAAARWLAHHLTAADLAALRGAVAAGDPEVGRWIAFALAERDAHVGLAVSLARDGDARVAELGREVLAELALRWSPGRDRAPKSGKELGEALENAASAPVATDARGTLESLVDRIARLAWDGPRIAVDPALRSASDGSTAADLGGEREAAPLALLIDLAETRGARLGGLAAADDDDAPLRWLCIAPKNAAGESGSSRLVRWLLDAADVERPERRRPAARALAETGWPAAIAWLEARAFAERDDVAFEALCVAAARGQAARSLARPEVQRDACARMARELARQSAEGDARADEIARALGAVGPFGPAGEDLAAALLDGISALEPREAWLRLVAVEAQRTRSAEARGALVALLAARREPPLALQALRALAAMDPPDSSGEADAPVVADAAALAAWCRARDATDELLRAVRASGARPRDGFRAALGAPDENADARAVLDALEWSLGARDAAYAGACLRSLAERDAPSLVEDAAQRLVPYVRAGFGADVAAAIDAARAPAPTATVLAALDALAVLSGSASDDVGARVLERARSSVARLDLACLGALAASPRGSDARSALVAAMPGARGADAKHLLAALTRAAGVLLASRAENDLREFVAAVRSAAREAVQPVRAGLRVDQWPPRLEAPVRRLEALDRRLSDLAGR